MPLYGIKRYAELTRERKRMRGLTLRSRNETAKDAAASRRVIPLELETHASCT